MKYKIGDLVRVKPYNDIAKNYELKYDKEKEKKFSLFLMVLNTKCLTIYREKILLDC